MKKILFLFLFLIVSLSITANNFRFESKLPAVDNTRYYKIQLTPGIYSKLRSGNSDLRLFDSNEQEVPYIIKDDIPINLSSSFVEYEIVYKNYLKDSLTQVIIENKGREPINNISLVVRNADVNKTMRLTGSYDRKQWFVVKENELISSIRNEKSVTEIKLINFPLTNYDFYKVEIDDKHSAPVDIIKAGYYEAKVTKGIFTQLKSSFVVSDSTKQKTTWVHLMLDDTLEINEVQFNIHAPEYFLRQVNVYFTNKKSKGNYRDYIDQLALNSKLPLRFAIGSIRTKELWFEVQNEDNVPLKLSDLQCFQINHYCIANLEKGGNYTLRLGDSLLNSPNYDLRHFQSVIPAALDVIIPGELKSIAPMQESSEENGFGKIFSDKRFIWISLVIVTVLLGFVTFRMMKDIK